MNVKMNEKVYPKTTGLEIAVIGMAGRFPGAKNIDEFWENLKNGVESISFFSDEELVAGGVDPELIGNTNYVRAKGTVEGIDYFDAHFFGYTHRDADILDPQSRFFLECSWEALEDAGYDPGSYDGLIGVFAGASENIFWRAREVLSDDIQSDKFLSLLFNNKDFMSLLVSYKLGLKGPSTMIFTACSTSLVAVHNGCQAILNGECDMVLAGGVKINLPDKNGYLYQAGMIVSPDGHCRAFDADAQGTVFGSGVGIVILKRLEEAIEDRDHIYSVIKGSAINNDGLRKVGFTAPSIEGQAEVIRTAQHMAHVDPASITYVEAHGTGTELGDPVEIEGLKSAFKTDRPGYCAVGSVKTNIGHLDTAAGVAGFIKTVLALKNKLIPPSLHLTKPNQKIDFENSPFYVNTKLKEWQNDEYPLRAGVSSFGIGGTNAHVVLEEAPELGSSSRTRPFQLILISARTQPSLERMTENLVTTLKDNPNTNLADAAYTLIMGRKHFKYRETVVCSSREEAVEIFSCQGSEAVHTSILEEGDKTVIFMFPGQGSQYTDMGLDLYNTEPIFRQEMDRCFEVLKHLVDFDIKGFLYPTDHGQPHHLTSSTPRPGDPDRINQTEIAQVVIFVFEYALARLLMSLGIEPYAMIGHSIGEYTAACLSGVFSLEDALRMVVSRGKLMQEMPPGSMLSIPLSEEELTPLLTDEISLAAVNSSSRCAVSGHGKSIDSFRNKLKEMGHESTLLHTSHAFHSSMMDPILGKFNEQIKKIKLNGPKIPYISNVTGKRITAVETTDTGYWCKHVRHTVRFSQGIETLLENEYSIFIELGPGNALSTFVRQHKDKKTSHFVINTVKHPKDQSKDNYFLLSKMGQLWLCGVKIDWLKFYSGQQRHRIPLPTYPFERLPLITGKDIFKTGVKMLLRKSLYNKNPNINEWFYIPVWEQSPPAFDYPGEKKQSLNWLLFIDDVGLGTSLVRRLKQDGQHTVLVEAGNRYAEFDDLRFVINPGKSDEYVMLFDKLQELAMIPDRIIHLWNVSMNDSLDCGFAKINRALDLGLYSLLYTVKAMGTQRVGKEIQIQVVTANMHHITGEENLNPLQAAALGPVKIIPLEYPNISCRSVDVVISGPRVFADMRLVENLLGEFEDVSKEILVAYRWKQRWLQKVKSRPLEKTASSIQCLREKGVYLVTGGFGGMGFTIAEDLAKRLKARLILLGRSPFPPRKEWQEWLANHDDDEQVGLKIRKILEVENMGAQVMTASADVSNEEQMRKVIARAEKKFGKINGIIHTAGLADYEGVIQKRTRQMTEKILAPKVMGTIILNRIFKDKKLDFFVLFSSIGNFLYRGKFGEVGYNAANEFLDAFAHYKTRENGAFTVAVNWSDWRDVGMSVEAVKRRFEKEGKAIDPNAFLRNVLLPSEGVEVFNRVLGNKLNRVVVSPLDLIHLLENIGESELEETRQPTPSAGLERPCLNTEYAAPGNETEQKLAEIWEKFFGLKQVGIHDDFFELGGDSLKAITIISHIEKIGYKISLNDILAYPTIHGLASVIPGVDTTGESPAGKGQEVSLLAGLECVERLNKGCNGKSIFIIHPLHGMVNQYKELAVLLENEYNVYGIQARGLKPGSKMPENPEQMINDYLKQILVVQKGGPYIIAGYCAGTIISYEIVRRLESLGHAVERLILFDAFVFFPDRSVTVLRLLEYLPGFVKRVIRFSNNRKYKKAIRTVNPGKMPGNDREEMSTDTGLRKEKFLKYMDILSNHVLPLEIIKAPILVPAAEASNFPRSTEAHFSRITRSKAMVIKGPGDHDSIFTRPHVEDLAKIIKNM